jgi:hypothetical protein
MLLSPELKLLLPRSQPTTLSGRNAGACIYRVKRAMGRACAEENGQSYRVANARHRRARPKEPRERARAGFIATRASPAPKLETHAGGRPRASKDPSARGSDGPPARASRASARPRPPRHRKKKLAGQRPTPVRNRPKCMAASTVIRVFGRGATRYCTKS